MEGIPAADPELMLGGELMMSMERPTYFYIHGAVFLLARARVRDVTRAIVALFGWCILLSREPFLLRSLPATSLRMLKKWWAG